MTGVYPRRVRLTEVGPRDGLQNEALTVPTEIKREFVRALIDAGHRDIEVTSFVRADRVPQLADAEDLLKELGPPPPGVTFSALVPNVKGLERALGSGVNKIAVFTGATDSFNEKNINATVKESLQRFGPVVRLAKDAGMRLRGYVSVAVYCPYEGWVDPSKPLEVMKRLFDIGCDEVSVGDTVGAAAPGDVARLLDALLPEITKPDALILHLHDTRGMALANILQGLQRGLFCYDVSAGGLGGCPFAPGSAGNVATEDVLFLLDAFGIEHGIDPEKQRFASTFVAEHLDRTLPSRVHGAPALQPRAQTE